MLCIGLEVRGGVEVCVCVCVCGSGGGRGVNGTESRGRPSSNLLRIRFLERVHKTAVCSVMDPRLHRVTRWYVLRVQILVRCLANSKCGRNHLCCHMFSVPTKPTHLESHTCSTCLTGAALCAWNTFRLHFAFRALLQDYTHRFLLPEGVSFSSFLLPPVSLVEILRLPPPSPTPHASLTAHITGLWLFVSYDGDQLWRPVASN